MENILSFTHYVLFKHLILEFLGKIPTFASVIEGLNALISNT